MILLNGKQVSADSLRNNQKESILCIAPKTEAAQIISALELKVQVTAGDSSTCFENHHGIDYMSIHIPEIADWLHCQGKLEIYFTHNCLLFFYDQENMVDLLFKEIMSNDTKTVPLETILYYFFCRLTEKDAAHLEDLEEEIADLEDSIADDKPNNYTRSISTFRKKLLILKRYYESLIDLLEDLEENQNGILSKEQLRFFHFQTNRADRLYHTVVSLRDYVTQVREAYQAQMDITLNKTMKFFTVITAIFLPLTLIVGWYGMNVQMPEYDFQYSYPIIILVSTIIVTGSIIYFKKNKWF